MRFISERYERTIKPKGKLKHLEHYHEVHNLSLKDMKGQLNLKEK